MRLSHLVIAVLSAAKGEAAAEATRKDLKHYRHHGLAARHELLRLRTVVCPTRYRTAYQARHCHPRRHRHANSTRTPRRVTRNGLGHLPVDNTLRPLMLPVLRQTTAVRTMPGRLAISNASLALAAKFPNENRSFFLTSFDDASQFEPTEQYSASKLLAHLFPRELTEHVPATDMIVNLADPSFVRGTETGREQSFVGAVAAKLLGTLAGRRRRQGRGVRQLLSHELGRQAVCCGLLHFGGQTVQLAVMVAARLNIGHAPSHHDARRWPCLPQGAGVAVQHPASQHKDCPFGAGGKNTIWADFICRTDCWLPTSGNVGTRRIGSRRRAGRTKSPRAPAREHKDASFKAIAMADFCEPPIAGHGPSVRQLGRKKDPRIRDEPTHYPPRVFMR